jgi:hypothetical protein
MGTHKTAPQGAFCPSARHASDGVNHLFNAYLGKDRSASQRIAHHAPLSKPVCTVCRPGCFLTDRWKKHKSTIMPRILSRTPSMVQAQRRRKSNASYPSAPSLRRVDLQQQQEAQSPKIDPHQRNETKFFSTTSLSLSELRQCENSIVESLVSSRSSSYATFLGNNSQSSSVCGQIVNNPRKSFKKQSSMPIKLQSSTSSSSDCSSWGLFVDVEEKHADLERRLSASLPTKIRS